MLLALSDEAFTSLDLWGSGPMLSDRAMRKALCAMPRLQVRESVAVGVGVGLGVGVWI